MTRQIGVDAMKKMSMNAIAVTAITLSYGLTVNADLMVGETIELTFEGKGPDREVEIEFGNSDFTTDVGLYNWTNGLQTFCSELTDQINVGQTVSYDIVAVANQPIEDGALLGEARATLLTDLFSRYYATFDNEGWTGKSAASFQMLVWEIRHETSDGTTASEILEDLSISNGYIEFEASNQVEDFARGMLNNLGADGFLSTESLVSLVSDEAQDHITIGSGSTAVPGSMGLAGLIGLVGFNRRRARRN